MQFATNTRAASWVRSSGWVSIRLPRFELVWPSKVRKNKASYERIFLSSGWAIYMPHICWIKGSLDVIRLDNVCIRNRAIMNAIRGVGSCYRNRIRNISLSGSATFVKEVYICTSARMQGSHLLKQLCSETWWVPVPRSCTHYAKFWLSVLAVIRFLVNRATASVKLRSVVIFEVSSKAFESKLLIRFHIPSSSGQMEGADCPMSLLWPGLMSLYLGKYSFLPFVRISS